MPAWAAPSTGLHNLLTQLYFNSPPPPPALTAPKPTVAGGIQDGLASVLEKVGYNPRHAQNVAGKATGFLNDVTPVGAAVSADNAKSDWQSGNYLGAAGNAIGALLSAIPDGGAAAGKGLGALHAIIAPLWHGSPHKFEQFALDKIGTGEGAQAYGHGLYFAENPDVAKSYIGSAQVPSATIARTTLDQYGGDRARAIADLSAQIKPWMTPERSPVLKALQELQTGSSGGHLYQVKLDANPEDFLDWNEPLTTQSPEVRGAAAQIYNDSPNMSARYAQDTLPDFPGHLFYDAFSREHGGRPGISAALQNNGVQGIKYLDQGSRTATSSPTRNYVVFDPSIIDILGRQ